MTSFVFFIGILLLKTWLKFCRMAQNTDIDKQIIALNVKKVNSFFAKSVLKSSGKQDKNQKTPSHRRHDGKSVPQRHGDAEICCRKAHLHRRKGYDEKEKRCGVFRYPVQCPLSEQGLRGRRLHKAQSAGFPSSAALRQIIYMRFFGLPVLVAARDIIPFAVFYEVGTGLLEGERDVI